MPLYLCISIAAFGIALLGALDDPRVTERGLPSKGTRDRYRVFMLVIAAIFLGILAFLTANRGIEIGNDTANYAKYFLIFREGLDSARAFEPGYQLYCYLIGMLTDDPHVFFQITAVIMYLALFVYIARYSNNIAFSLCLAFCFCYPVFMNTLRQAFAMLIIMFAYQQLKKRRDLLFVALLLVAMTFHKTAIIAICLLFSRWAPKKLPQVFLVCGIAGILAISGCLSDILRHLSGSFAHYFDGQYASSGWLAISFYVSEYALFYYVVEKGSRAEGRERRIILANFFALLFFTSLGFSVNLFSRLSSFFSFIAISELPNALCGGNLTEERGVSVGISLLVVAFFMLVLLLRPSWNHLYPYTFWS